MSTEEMGTLLPLLILWLGQLTVVQGAVSSYSVCGVSAIDSRIVGGHDATPGSWPWQVAILKEGHTHCGGSIINERWVLSASHCFFLNQSAKIYQVVVGGHKLLDWTTHTKLFNVSKIILHPSYTQEENLIGDIALVKLPSPLTFTDYVRPVCLPDSSVKFPQDANCSITGWGAIQEKVDLPVPLTLQELKVPLINQSFCNILYNTGGNDSMGKDPIKHDMICAGYVEGKKDSCQGDSGGPLVCKLHGFWIQAGVQSWGHGCAQANYPGVYASTTFYAKWIDETLAANSGRQNLRWPSSLMVTLFWLSSAAVLH